MAPGPKLAWGAALAAFCAGAALEPIPGAIAWSERFEGPALDWVAPLGEGPAQIAAIYEVQRGPSGAWLHAHHEYRGRGRVKPVTYGKAWAKEPFPLERVRALRWRWRVNQHPPVEDDAWVDLAASLYVVVRQPAWYRNGKGFKFGWLARPGAKGTKQVGLLQIALHSDSQVGEWRSEEVDLCALYRKHYGPCEGEFLRFVGVTTDADGTRAVADADYADLELVVDASPAAAVR